MSHSKKGRYADWKISRFHKDSLKWRRIRLSAKARKGGLSRYRESPVRKPP